MILDAPILTEPRAWHITKINRISSNGLCNITLAQDKFDQNRDYIEVDENGNVIGMWADYYKHSQVNDYVDAVILEPLSYSGIKPDIRVNGGYKKITALKDGGIWAFKIDDEDADVTILTSKESDDINDNQIKIKLKGTNELIGNKLTITNTSDNTIQTVILDIVG